METGEEMPSKTKKQQRFFASCKHNPKHRGDCPPADVVDEFVRADKAKGRQRRAQRRSKGGRRT